MNHLTRTIALVFALTCLLTLAGGSILLVAARAIQANTSTHGMPRASLTLLLVGKSSQLTGEHA